MIADLGTQELLSLGVGFALAYIVLQWKRIDDKKHAEDLISLTERLFSLEEKAIGAVISATAATNRVADALDNFVNLSDILSKIDGIDRKLKDVNPEVVGDD